MLSSALKDLMLRLYQGTIEGNINWETVPDSQTSFAVFFPEYSVRIVMISSSRQVRTQTGTLATRTEIDYRLQLLDSTGNIIETIRSATYPNEQLNFSYTVSGLLEALYTSARENATGIDRAVASILESLEAQRPNETGGSESDNEA